MNPEIETEAGTKAWATALRKKVHKLAQDHNVSYMELGRLLYEVFDKPVRDGHVMQRATYASWGYPSFAEYVERELNIQKRKAEKLRLIWFKLEVELKNLTSEMKERVVGLGWTKAYEVVQVLTNEFPLESIEKWVAFAEKTNYQQINYAAQKYRHEHGAAKRVKVTRAVEVDETPVPQEEHLEEAAELPPPPPEGSVVDEAVAIATAEMEKNGVRSAREETAEKYDPPEGAPRSRSFKLYEEQWATVESALVRARELSASQKDGHNITLICMDFLATNSFTRAGIHQKLQFIAKLERLLDLKLMAVDSDSLEVLYGFETLDAMASEAPEVTNGVSNQP